MSDYTIERAYELADMYADMTNGFVGIRIMRYRFPATNHVDIDYVLTGQALWEPKSFRSISTLIDRLETLLKEKK